MPPAIQLKDDDVEEVEALPGKFARPTVLASFANTSRKQPPIRLLLFGEAGDDVVLSQIVSIGILQQSTTIARKINNYVVLRLQNRKISKIHLCLLLLFSQILSAYAWVPQSFHFHLLQVQVRQRTKTGTTFQLFQQLSSLSNKKNDTEIATKIASSSTKGKQPNKRVRDIVDVLLVATSTETSSTSIVSPPPDTKASISNNINNTKLGLEWSKMRNYLYSSRGDISVDQVQRVVQFLQHVLAEDKELVRSVLQTNPRILRKSVKSFLRPTADFLLDLYGPDLLREAVKRNPGILLSRGVGSDASQSSVTRTKDYLKSKLGLRAMEVKTLMAKAPWLFQRSTDQIESVVGFWDGILQHDSGKTHLARQTILGKLLKTYPTLFNLSVEQGLTAKVMFLEEQCGLTRQDVASLLSGSRAALFCLSVEDNLQPTLKLLEGLMPSMEEDDAVEEEDEQQRQKAKREQIRKCVLKHPQILCLSQKNLNEKISYFDSIDSFSCRDVTPRKEALASRVAVRSPAVYSLSLKENIIPKIAFLSGVWGKKAPQVCWEGGKLQIITTRCEATKAIEANADSDAEETSSIAGLLGEYPSILTLSLEGNIQPTLNFYNRTGFIHLDSDWKLAVAPAAPKAAGKDQQGKEAAIATVSVIRARYIASSLFQRLLPRWHFYLTNRERFPITIKATGVHKLSLHILSVANDMVFCEYIGADLDDYTSFKEDAVPRLKFSSQFDTWLKTGRPIDV